MNNLDKKLEAAVYGEAVADALGVPYEFRGRGSFTCTGMVGGGSHRQPAGTFSDDTSMMLATLDSLNHCGGHVDQADMLARFRSWRYAGKYTADGVVFDVGGTTDAALQSGSGCDGMLDNGNGSLMRIIPLAFFDVSDEEIRLASAVTHAHRISTESCVNFVRIARLLLAGADPVRAIGEAGYGSVTDKSRDEIRSGGYVRDTLQAALWCLASTASYSECALSAVNLGDDTDTTAAVAGALAGIVYEFGDDRGIPDGWVDALRGKDVIDCVLSGL